MDYSMDLFAQSLNSDIVNTPFPLLSSCPTVENVNPGIGLIVNMHHLFVPFVGKSNYVIEKKTEDLMDNDQEGTGDNDQTESLLQNEKDDKMDPKVVESFNHPKLIKTEKLVIPKDKKLPGKNIEKRKFVETEGKGHVDFKRPKHFFKVE